MSIVFQIYVAKISKILIFYLKLLIQKKKRMSGNS